MKWMSAKLQQQHYIFMTNIFIIKFQFKCIHKLISILYTKKQIKLDILVILVSSMTMFCVNI